MGGYYAKNLSAERLRRCYEIASPRVRQYLAAEIAHVLGSIQGRDTVLELGCGYGRVLARLAGRDGPTLGIDNSGVSLAMASRELNGITNCHVAVADALQLPFGNAAFDRVLCLQNGISAFAVDRRALVREAVRVLSTGGQAVFSTYSSRFWADRLDWFRRQAKEGLLGDIDEERTGDGVIVCHDGFRATTVSREEFGGLTGDLDADVRITEVDGSSLFCEITRRG